VAKVLVIDDDEMHLMLMGNILENAGYSVSSTADGPQGIMMFKEHPPNLVLLDLGLPSMNGIEVLREIRTADPKSKVIVVTGYGSIESAEVALRYGAWDYVEKPIEVENFLEKIRTAIGIAGDDEE